MEFDRIKYDGTHVELAYKEPLASGDGTRDCLVHGEDPSPAFRHALQAFTSFVVWIHSWTADAAERVEIRGVSIKRPDDGPRGITVTGLLKCPRARNSTSTFNTPFLAEAPDGYAGDFAGYLKREVVDFVDDLEGEASLYLGGDRGEQIALELGAPETPPVQSSKKPKKGKDFVPGVGEIANPNATEPMTDAALRQLLLSVERDVPLDAIQRWGSLDRDRASAWAMAQQKRLVGQMKEADMPAEPKCVKKDATLGLSADAHWGDEKQVRVSDQGAEKIRSNLRLN